MHNHNGKNNKLMMWMMIPCLLLLAFVLFGGNGLGASKYLVFIMLGVCVIPHLWMMFKGGHGDEHSDTNTEDGISDTITKNKDEKSKDSNSCH